MNIKVFISVVLIFNLITSDVFAVPIDGNPNDNLVNFSKKKNHRIIFDLIF